MDEPSCESVAEAGSVCGGVASVIWVSWILSESGADTLDCSSFTSGASWASFWGSGDAGASESLAGSEDSTEFCAVSGCSVSKLSTKLSDVSI